MHHFVSISLVGFRLVGFLSEYKYPKNERSYINFKVFDQVDKD